MNYEGKNASGIDELQWSPICSIINDLQKLNYSDYADTKLNNDEQ